MLLRTYQSNSERVVKLQRMAVTTEVNTAMDRNAMRSFRLIVTAAIPPLLRSCASLVAFYVGKALFPSPSTSARRESLPIFRGGLLRNQFIPNAVNRLKALRISRIILNLLA